MQLKTYWILTLTLYWTIIPKFSFCVGSWMSVLEARLVSSCFSWPSNAVTIDSINCWLILTIYKENIICITHLGPTYPCYSIIRVLARRLCSMLILTPGGTHPLTPGNHKYYHTWKHFIVYLFIDSAFVLGSREKTYVSKLPHRNFYLLHSFVGIILKST